MLNVAQLINNLNSIINSKFIKVINTNCELIEENNDANASKATVLKIQANVKNFAYSLDAKCKSTGSNLNPFDIFNSGTVNICSKNDLTILCPIDDQKVLKVFIIEMKSFNSSGASHQIRSGKNFVDYLISVHNLNFSHLPYRVEVFGILAKKAKSPLKPTTNTKNRTFIFNAKDYKGYLIPTLEWNVDEILPLPHIIKNMKIKVYN